VQAGFISVGIHLAESSLGQIADELRILGAGGMNAGVVDRAHADGRSMKPLANAKRQHSSFIEFCVVFSRINCQEGAPFSALLPF
jgi:hypothetical protein